VTIVPRTANTTPYQVTHREASLAFDEATTSPAANNSFEASGVIDLTRLLPQVQGRRVSISTTKVRTESTGCRIREI
jgi:hypothetical protein